MATPSLRDDPALEPFVISSVRPTGKILGKGSYGEVLEAKIPGATCAVKKLHDILQTEDAEWVDPQMVAQNRGKFISECQLMSRLRHPHIVQFLGIVFFPGSDTPALVTERLLTDLHSLLLPSREGQCKPYIPLGLKYSILHDVSQGLFFLHSRNQPIIHRDLTAANVLLNSAMVAKIADLGVARLMPMARAAMARAAMTKGPGNIAYMPPEAQEGSMYDASIDIFSFGVLALFALTQTFPDPLPATYTDRGKVEARTEVQRRSAFIAQIPSESHSRNPLVGVIEQCLDNIPAQRPKIQRVLELMEAAKAEGHDTHTQMNKLELVQAIEREREELSQQHNRERAELVQQKDGERDEVIRQKDRERDEVIRQKDRERDEVIRQKDGERDEVIRQKDGERDEVIRQKDGERDEVIRQKDRERDEVIRQKDREREEAIRQKDREKDQEREEAITQKKEEKEEALQQQEREIINESKGVLGVNEEGEVMGRPPDKRDRLHVLLAIGLGLWLSLALALALYYTAKPYDVFSIQVSKPGMELSHSYSQVEYLFLKSPKKEKGKCSTLQAIEREREEIVQQHNGEREKLKQLKDREREEGIKEREKATKGGEAIKEREEEISLNEKKPETRAVVIIRSITQPPSARNLSSFSNRQPLEVVPQSPAVLSGDDRQVLAKLGLPPDNKDNLNVLLTMYNRAEHYDVFSVQVSKPGMELSRSYVLEQVEYLLMNSAKKDGAIIHYYGNGRRNTGDWCFRDGFITFRDIADLYMKHSRGRVLTIIPDCHASGHWVAECAKFLDEEGVRPCGHSAREKGILLRVYAACKTGQDTAELCYTTRAMGVKSDGRVYHWLGKELSDHQNSFGVDFTSVRCGKGEGEECAIASDSTWSTASEVTSGRQYIVRGYNKDRPVWYYVLLDDDAEKIKEFIHKMQGENAGKYTVDATDYGTVLRSGRGKDPKEEDKDWMVKKYGWC